jgi:hypothetical protein
MSLRSADSDVAHGARRHAPGGHDGPHSEADGAPGRPATGPRGPGQAPGVPNSLLVGHASTGGLGLLPLRQHIRARDAIWAIRFITGAIAQARAEPTRGLGGTNGVGQATGDDARGCHPWIRTLSAYLELAHPAFKPWALTTARATGPWLGGGQLPEDISRIIGALGHLPPLEDVRTAPPDTGSWCWAAALWGNPLLPNAPGAGGSGCRPGLEFYHGALTGCRKFRTVGDLERVCCEIQRVADLHDVEWQTWVRWNLEPEPAATPQLRDKGATLAALTALRSDISPAWL